MEGLFLGLVACQPDTVLWTWWGSGSVVTGPLLVRMYARMGGMSEGWAGGGTCSPPPACKEKKLATLMPWTSAVVSVSTASMGEALADLHRLAKWFGFLQLLHIFPQALHFCFLSSGEFVEL